MAESDAEPQAEPLDDQQLYDAMTRAFWVRGELDYRLKTAQKEMWRQVAKSNRFKYVIKCARRLGKSFFLLSTACSVARRKPGAIVRYAAPTQKMVRKIIHPLMKIITDDCPVELRPVWKGADGMYLFPGTNSEIHIAGVNNGHADDHRGTYCDLFVIDEAGFVDDLHYLIHDVALPQLLDEDMAVVKDRRLLIASSPARSPAHEFKKISDEAEAEGNYSHYDIFDGHYSKDIIRLFLKEDGVSEEDITALLAGDYENVKSTTVLREYLALDVVDENFALCPEWKQAYVQEFQTDKYFSLYHKYDALDVGVRDLSVCLFAHYDFAQARLYIHDEFVINGPQMTTEVLARGIRAKEEALFPKMKIRKRVSDIDLLLIQDLHRLHNLYFEPTDKGELEQMVNQVRIWVGAGRIIVHPRCKQTIGCLKSGVWNEQRKDFDRSVTFGHFDAFAALMYLVRNVDTATNPVPFDFEKPIADHWLTDTEQQRRKEKLKKMLNVR